MNDCFSFTPAIKEIALPDSFNEELKERINDKRKECYENKSMIETAHFLIDENYYLMHFYKDFSKENYKIDIYHYSVNDEEVLRKYFDDDYENAKGVFISQYKVLTKTLNVFEEHAKGQCEIAMRERENEAFTLLRRVKDYEDKSVVLGYFYKNECYSKNIIENRDDIVICGALIENENDYTVEVIESKNNITVTHDKHEKLSLKNALNTLEWAFENVTMKSMIQYQMNQRTLTNKLYSLMNRSALYYSLTYLSLVAKKGVNMIKRSMK